MEWRRHQKEAVDAIVTALRDGTETVILSAGTGAGKSLILASVAKELGWRTMYTTPVTNLVQQIHEDPLFHHVLPSTRAIIGRNGWTCHRDGYTPVSQATCFEIAANGQLERGEDAPIPCRYKKWDADNDRWPECPYYLRKAACEMAPCMVTTFSYFMVATAPKQPGRTEAVPGWDAGRLSGRDLLVVDEAHGMAEQAIKHVQSRWRTDSYDALGWTNAFTKFSESGEFRNLTANEPTMDDVQKGDILMGLLAHLTDIRETVQHFTEDDLKTAAKLDWDIDVLGRAIDDMKNGIPWVVRAEAGVNPSLDMIPVKIHGQLKYRVWNRADKYILSSATILDPKWFLEELGLEPANAEVVEVPSDFPPANCPVIFHPVTKFTYKNREQALPEVGKALWEVMAKEGGRGLVHTKSFANARWLYSNAPDQLKRRLMLHNPEDGRSTTVQSFLNSPPGTVMMSPSLTEGLDLPGAAGEWAYFVKCPYLSMEDERIKRRVAMDDGSRWLDLQAVTETIQGHGRVTRSNTDTSRTYIVDEKHIETIKRWWKFLPQWFRDRIVEGYKHAW